MTSVTYTFYPSNNSETQFNVANVGGTPDSFGCIDTVQGVYVPTPQKDVTEKTLERIGTVCVGDGSAGNGGTDIFGDPL
jgi:hypothetical protein